MLYLRSLLTGSLGGIFLLLSFGCTVVRTSAEDPQLIAVWFLANDQEHRLVARVLQDHGVNATVDSHGVTVDENDRLKAKSILLKDERLKETSLMLWAMVKAGTGVQTKDGIFANVLIAQEIEAEE